MLKHMEEKELVERFGQLVRTLRTEKGFSQEEFAYACGVHRTYMGLIERGKRVVTIAVAHKIAKGLDLTLGDLFSQVQER